MQRKQHSSDPLQKYTLDAQDVKKLKLEPLYITANRHKLPQYTILSHKVVPKNWIFLKNVIMHVQRNICGLVVRVPGC
jgi:hypothetical protein